MRYGLITDDATVLALAKKPSIKPEQLATVRSIASGAAALPQDIRDKLKEKFDIIVTDGECFLSPQGTSLTPCPKGMVVRNALLSSVHKSPSTSLLENRG